MSHKVAQLSQFMLKSLSLVSLFMFLLLLIFLKCMNPSVVLRILHLTPLFLPSSLSVMLTKYMPDYQFLQSGDIHYVPACHVYSSIILLCRSWSVVLVWLNLSEEFKVCLVPGFVAEVLYHLQKFRSFNCLLEVHWILVFFLTCNPCLIPNL